MASWPPHKFEAKVTDDDEKEKERALFNRNKLLFSEFIKNPNYFRGTLYRSYCDAPHGIDTNLVKDSLVVLYFAEDGKMKRACSTSFEKVKAPDRHLIKCPDFARFPLPSEMCEISDQSLSQGYLETICTGYFTEYQRFQGDYIAIYPPYPTITEEEILKNGITLAIYCRDIPDHIIFCRFNTRCEISEKPRLDIFYYPEVPAFFTITRH